MALRHIRDSGLNEFYKEMKEKRWKEEPIGLYIVIPRYITDNKKIPATAKLIWGQIAALARKEGYCYATNKFLAKILGCSEDTIQIDLRILKKRGLVKIELEKNNTGTRRKLWVITCGKTVYK